MTYLSDTITNSAQDSVGAEALHLVGVVETRVLEKQPLDAAALAGQLGPGRYALIEVPGRPDLELGSRPEGSVIRGREHGGQGETVTVEESRSIVTKEVGRTLVVVGAVFAILFDAQFHFNLDWLLAAGARERMEAVRDLIIGELEVTAPDEWERVLQRYSTAHHVRFALFDEEATPLVGGITTLPEEVRLRLLMRPDSNRSRPPSARCCSTSPASRSAPRPCRRSSRAASCPPRWR